MIDISVGLEVEELRLVDEVFMKVCNMINDLSLEVKVKAANLLVRLKKLQEDDLNEKKLLFRVKSKA